MSESPKKIHDDFKKDENLLTSAAVNPVESDLKDSEVGKLNPPFCSESEATSFVVHQPTECSIESSVEISQASKDECLQVVQEEKNDSLPNSPENSVTGSDSNLPQTFPLPTNEIVGEEVSIPVSISLKEQPFIGLESELKHPPFESKILSDSGTQNKQASPDSESSLSSQASAYVFNVTDKEMSSSSSDVKDEQVSPSTSNISETFNEDSSVSSLIQSEEISLGLEKQSSLLPSSPPQTTDEESLVAPSIDSECTTELGHLSDEKGSSSMAISLERQALIELEPKLTHSISVSSDYFSSSSAVQEKQVSPDTVLSTISQTDDPVLKTAHEEISYVKEKHQISSPSSNSEIKIEGSTSPSSIKSKDLPRLDIYSSHKSTVLSQAGVYCSIVSEIHSKQQETEFKEITPSISTINPTETVSKISDNLPMSSEQSEIKLDEALPILSSSENNSQYDSSPTMPAEQLLTEDEKEVSQTVPSNPSEIQNESSIPSITLPKKLTTEPDSEIPTTVAPTLTSDISENECSSSLPEVINGPPPLSTTFVLIKNSKDSISNETEVAAKKMLKQVTRIKFMLKELKEMESLLNRGFRSSNNARRAATIDSSSSDKKCTGSTTMHLYAQEVRFEAAQLFVQIENLCNWFRLNEDIDERINVYKSDVEKFLQIAGDMLNRFNHGIYH